MRTPLQLTLIFLALFAIAPSSHAQTILPELDNLKYPEPYRNYGIEDTCLVQFRILNGKALVQRSHCGYQFTIDLVEKYLSKVRFSQDTDCVDFKFRFLVVDGAPKMVFRYDTVAQCVTLVTRHSRFVSVDYATPISERDSWWWKRYPW